MAHQKELRIVTKRPYSISKDVTIRCWICGRDFVEDFFLRIRAYDIVDFFIASLV